MGPDAETALGEGGGVDIVECGHFIAFIAFIAFYWSVYDVFMECAYKAYIRGFQFFIVCVESKIFVNIHYKWSIHGLK